MRDVIFEKTDDKKRTARGNPYRTPSFQDCHSRGKVSLWEIGDSILEIEWRKNPRIARYFLLFPNLSFEIPKVLSPPPPQ